MFATILRTFQKKNPKPAQHKMLKTNIEIIVID